jgi:hypothetical protein
MGQVERTKKYLTHGSGADLVRVEVLVPAHHPQAVLDEARRLRSIARRPLSALAIALHDEAMARFKIRCFWNAAPPQTEAGLRAVADRLQNYGDMAA